MIRVRAVQNDRNSRLIEAHLYTNNNEKWVVPNGITASFGYQRSDGSQGLYDTLSNGTKAVTIVENVVTATLIPQVLEEAGIVDAVIIFQDSAGNQLSTFPFKIHVEKSPVAGVGGVENPDIGVITPSGEITITQNGTYNVTPYASAVVTFPEADLAEPAIEVSKGGLITAKVSQEAGVVSAGVKSTTLQLPTQSGKAITPSSISQTAVSAGKYLTGDIIITGDDNLNPNNIKVGVTIFGVTGSCGAEGGIIPSGTLQITENGTFDVTNYAAAKVSLPEVTQATPSISVDSTGKITASVTQSAGVVPAGTKSATKQLTKQAAQTITPGTSDKTIASGRYLTGTQTIKGDANLKAENIKSGVSIFGVLGTFEGSGGGNGGLAYKTGSVTVDESCESFMVDTGLTSIDCIIVSRGEEKTDNTSGTWYWSMSPIETRAIYYYISGTYLRYNISAVTSKVIDNNGIVTVEQYTSSYPIYPGTYTWVAFGKE